MSLFAGSVWIGQLPGGGWRVKAELPLPVEPGLDQRAAAVPAS